MFARLGRVVVHHPWRVIAAWVIAAIAIIVLSPKLPSSTNESDFLPRHYESIKAQQLQAADFPGAFKPSAIMVFTRPDGSALSASDSTAVAGIAGKLTDEQIAQVQRIASLGPSANKLVQIVGVAMPDETQSNMSKQFDAVKKLRTDGKAMASAAGLKLGITGAVAQGYDQQQSSSNAGAIVGIATIGLIIVLLLIIFRSPIIALLPVVVIGVVSQVANGLISDVSHAFGLKADSSISELLIVVLFGVGTDYILFLMFRYREALRSGEDPKQAMVSAVTRVGEAIASAAGVVIAAFLALALSSLGIFTSLGPSLAIAVAVTLLAGLTLVPAVVSLLGTKVFWPSKAWKREPTGARYAAIGRALGRRPAAFAGVAGVVMVVLAVGVVQFSPSFDLSAGALPKTAESQVAQQTLQRGFPAGATDQSHVYLQAAASSSFRRGDLDAYAATLRSVHGVGAVTVSEVNKGSSAADFVVTLSSDPASDRALSTVKGPLRTVAHHSAPVGSTALVGGTTSVYVDIKAAMDRDYAVVFPAAAILIMIILGLLLRSVIAPLYLMVSVGLGFGATLGATTCLFQDLRNAGGLIFLLPMIMYMFVVALGTDYNILMVARLREESKAGRSPREAAALAIRHAGPTIGAAGVILAGSFASLILAGNALLAQMGFAISFGIVIAAFVMALFFTPSLTALIGHTAWWPGHGDRVVGPPERPATIAAREPVLDRD